MNAVYYSYFYVFEHIKYLNYSYIYKKYLYNYNIGKILEKYWKNIYLGLCLQKQILGLVVFEKFYNCKIKINLKQRKQKFL